MPILDLILGALIALMVVWGFSRGVTVNTLALAGLGVGAVLGARLAPLLLSGGLHSSYAPEAAIPAAVLLGAVTAALFERFGLRQRRRLHRLGIASPIGGAVLGGTLGLALVWIVGVVAIQVGSLRGEIRNSAILRPLDAALVPPGPVLAPEVRYADPFPTVRGQSPVIGALGALVTRSRGVRTASRSVVRVVVLYCHTAKSGTGWIASDGIVATNAHVAAAGEVIGVQFRGKAATYPAMPIWFDPKNDLALLHVPDLRGVPALALVAHPRAGTAAATIGFPGGRWQDRPARLGPTSTQIVGELSTREPMPREFSHELFGRWITTFSGRVEPGNSGSPVVDAQGRVLATAFAGGPGDGFGVPNGFVRSALRHAGPPVSTGPCPPGSSR